LANWPSRELGSREVVIRILGSAVPARAYSSSAWVLGAVRPVRCGCKRLGRGRWTRTDVAGVQFDLAPQHLLVRPQLGGDRLARCEAPSPQGVVRHGAAAGQADVRLRRTGQGLLDALLLVVDLALLLLQRLAVQVLAPLACLPPADPTPTPGHVSARAQRSEPPAAPAPQLGAHTRAQGVSVLRTRACGAPCPPCHAPSSRVVRHVATSYQTLCLYQRVGWTR
jgi:hypothetical protein